MTRLILCTCIALSLAATASAVIIPFSLVDNDGPAISGFVDTTADQATFNTWTENSGGVDFFTPVSLPIVLDAVDSTGASFDVGDDWDGTIGSTWAFIAPLDNFATAWNEGAITNDFNQFFGLGGAFNGTSPFAFAGNETNLLNIPRDTTGGTSSATFDTVTTPEGYADSLMLMGLAGVGLIVGRRRGERIRRDRQPHAG